MGLTRYFELAESKIRFDLRRRSLIFLSVLPLVLATACASGESKENSTETLVDAKYSLQADREALEELRKDIPPETKKENDEKAFFDQLMADESRHPSEVQNQFTKMMNKKRDLFNKDMNKVREQFNGQQKKARESFTEEQSSLRKDFSRQKATPNERKEFFDKLEGKRKDFYSQQKEQRDEFEADFRDKRKNFEDYVRAKNAEFNQLYRDYGRRYQERKKLQLDAKKLNEKAAKEAEKSLDMEYEPIRKKQPIYLEPQDKQE